MIQLLQIAQASGKEADRMKFWEAVFTEMLEDVLGLAFRYFKSRDLAEEHTFAVFEKMMSNVPLLYRLPAERERDLRKFIITVVLNFYRDQLRKKKRNRMIGLEEVVGEDFLAQDDIDKKELRMDLLAALQTLSPLNQQIVQRYLEGYSYQDIAEDLGVPLVTVRNSLYRSKGRMRRWLGNH